MKSTKWIPAAALLVCTFAACKKDDNSNSTTLSNQDRTFMTNASYSNNAEIDAGSTAASMGSITSVKNFGSMMVTDHTKAQADMATLASQTAVSGLPTTPDSAHIQMKAMLMTLSGRRFDSAYIKMQVADHINTINLMQTEISSGSDQMVKDYATSHLPVVQMHKQMADSIVMANGF